jgi:hypothetical protein
MSLLQAAENLLGTVFTWLRVILKYVFVDKPAYWTALALISFFYGNGVPLEMAVQLFRACNENADDLLARNSYYF